jgi:uncharacterized protein (DUF3820 family)
MPFTCDVTDDILDQPEFATIRNEMNQQQQQKLIQVLKRIRKAFPAIAEYYHRCEKQHMQKKNPPVITWGKYKGAPIAELPESYIDWIRNANGIPEGAKSFVLKVYDNREITKENTKIDIEDTF